jgi:hypothetical protein
MVQPAADLSFDRPVPRGEVHKRAVQEVLITDSAPLDAASFALAAQLPRAHRLYGPDPTGRYDALALGEVVRQATFVVGHRYLDVPADRQFVLGGFGLRVEGEPLADAAAPLDVTVHVEPSELRYLGGELSRYELTGTVLLGGRAVAEGSGSCLCLTPRSYEVLRRAGTGDVDGRGGPAEALEARAEPGAVVRGDLRDVVVTPLRDRSDERATAGVVVDPSHPSFFDHPLDHVPGMLLLEACRQTALQLTGGGLVTAFTAEFVRVAELGFAVECGAERRPDGGFDLRVEQAGQPVMEATMEVRP